MLSESDKCFVHMHIMYILAMYDLNRYYVQHTY